MTFHSRTSRAGAVSGNKNLFFPPQIKPWIQSRANGAIASGSARKVASRNDTRGRIGNRLNRKIGIGRNRSRVSGIRIIRIGNISVNELDNILFGRCFGGGFRRFSRVLGWNRSGGHIRSGGAGNFCRNGCFGNRGGFGQSSSLGGRWKFSRGGRCGNCLSKGLDWQIGWDFCRYFGR